MNENRMVKLISTSNSTVVVSRPEYGIRREWQREGSFQMIPFNTVEQLLFTTGFRNMIDTGTLYIDNMQDKIDLGLEEVGTTVPTNIVVLTEAERAKLLSPAVSFKEFVQVLSKVTVDQAQKVVDYAAKHNLIDYEKTDYLKAITGRDIIAIIAHNRQLQEMDRVAAAKEASRKDPNNWRR